MVINDKALARTLKRTGQYGFKFCVNGTAARLVGWDFAARIQLSDTDEPPKMTLAALVEMLGFLPVDGECGHIYKVKNGWEWQDMTPAVFDSDYNELAHKERSTIDCAMLPVRYITRPLILTTEQRIYSVAGPMTLAEEWSGFFFKEPGSLCFGDDSSELFLSCYRPEQPGKVWRQLEALDWEENHEGQD